jgi:hypothetical protein
MENQIMSPHLKEVVELTRKQIEPLIHKLPKEGKNNYLTYYKVLSQFEDEGKRKFVSIVMMQMSGINKMGLLETFKLLNM